VQPPPDTNDHPATGNSVPEGEATPATRPWNKLAIVSAVMAIVFPLAAIVSGFAALLQIRLYRQRGRWLAWLAIAVAIAWSFGLAWIAKHR
jgi:hypothetical protein